MGAGNSTPQTARIENPNRGVVPIQITPSVVTRLEEQQKLQQQQCSCGNGNEDPKEQNNEEQQENNAEQQQYEYNDPHTSYKQRVQNPLLNRNKVPQAPQQWSEPSDDAAERENQFNATLEKLEHIIGKPLAWEENVEKEILKLRRDIINCYQDHPSETLNCSDAAIKYQAFIFREQFRNILKFNTLETHEPNASSLPHHHTPPYK